MNKTPYIRVGDYDLIKHFDHDDVEIEFTVDKTLNIVANTLAAFGVFAALMIAIAVAMQLPDGAIAWRILTVWGL